MTATAKEQLACAEAGRIRTPATVEEQLACAEFGRERTPATAEEQQAYADAGKVARREQCVASFIEDVQKRLMPWMKENARLSRRRRAFEENSMARILHRLEKSDLVEPELRAREREKAETTYKGMWQTWKHSLLSMMGSGHTWCVPR